MICDAITCFMMGEGNGLPWDVICCLLRTLGDGFVWDHAILLKRENGGTLGDTS